MNKYLSLDLDDLAIDPTLMAHLPVGLAAYYLALPLASEDGAISVAMVCPENQTALAVLDNLLGGPIVPVRASATAIRWALARYNGNAISAPPSRVLVWSADQTHADFVNRVATLFAAPLMATITCLASSELNLANVLTVARKGQYRLTIIYPPDDVAPTLLLRQIPAPLLLVQDTLQTLRRILIVLRGYATDEQILDWLAPLLRPDVSVTLLPLPPVVERYGQPPLLLNDMGRRHLRNCLNHPALLNTEVLIKFRQGRVVNQVAEESREDSYDLIVIAAEEYGCFVNRILRAIGQQRGHWQHSFFILKPPTGEGGCSE